MFSLCDGVTKAYGVSNQSYNWNVQLRTIRVVAVPGCGFFDKSRGSLENVIVTQNGYIRFAFCKGDSTFDYVVGKMQQLVNVIGRLKFLSVNERIYCRNVTISFNSNVIKWPPIVTLGMLLPHARGLGFKPRRGGFPSGAKKKWGLSPKAKVRVLHTAQLDVTVSSNH
nr:kynurenine--oxoglutarate transaminase [Tanacetum cinerariifolium]